METHIEVVLRIRPLSESEVLSSPEIAVNCLSNQLCRVNVGAAQTHTFTFDRVFNSDVTQDELFNSHFNANIDGFLSGSKGAIIAYGQTASGKSYTMTGGTTPEAQGIIPRAIHRIFDNYSGRVKMSFVELYNDKLLDLLNSRTPVAIMGDGTLKDATVFSSSSYREVMHAIVQGNRLRSTGSTKMNDASSRSHSLVVLQLDNDAKLILVDLAGSEQVRKSGASGKVLEEASHINKSLSNLAMVTAALTSASTTSANTGGNSAGVGSSASSALGQAHVPYRASKLTHMLRSALGGDSLTTIIINCSPARLHVNETLGSLRFGVRAKKVVNIGVDELHLENAAQTKFRYEMCKRLNIQWQINGPQPFSALAEIHSEYNYLAVSPLPSDPEDGFMDEQNESIALLEESVAGKEQYMNDLLVRFKEYSTSANENQSEGKERLRELYMRLDSLEGHNDGLRRTLVEIHPDDASNCKTDPVEERSFCREESEVLREMIQQQDEYIAKLLVKYRHEGRKRAAHEGLDENRSKRPRIGQEGL